MTQYASQSDLASFGLPTTATSGIAGSVLDEQLTAASEIAESYLSGRGYTLPLTAWGRDLRSAVARIAAWYIIVNTRGVNPEDPGHAGLRMNHDDAMKWLEQVAKGRANLNGVATSPERSSVGLAVISTNTRRYT